MGRDAKTGPSDAGLPGSDILLHECRARLADRGETIVGSGSFHCGPISAAIHCDFGPAEQEKWTNQDYALAWRSAANGDRQSPRLVVALSDGLTNSFRSECAAALACWVAARAIIEADEGTTPRELARSAFDQAGLAIGRLADDLARDPEASCPEEQFPSTWKYILKKGGLLQTTLTLAWRAGEQFHIAALGDGGALWRGYEGPLDARQATDRILAACDLNSQQVNAIGPARRTVSEFDCWHSERIEGPFLCALSTDGIGRGMGAKPLALLDELDRLQAAGVENPPRRFIEQAIRESPRKFDDNLTLALIRAE